MNRDLARVCAVTFPLVMASCMIHASSPLHEPSGALAGIAPASFDGKEACIDWSEATKSANDAHARDHDSFPEWSKRSCYTRVHFGKTITFDTPSADCLYPSADAGTAIRSEAKRYEAIANGDDHDLPVELACAIPAEIRRNVAANNARTLRSLLNNHKSPTYPYAAVSTFGFGDLHQNDSPLVSWLPGDACPKVSKAELDALNVNEVRVGRAARALAAGVAPVMTLSGGAVHSHLYEALMMDWMATCVLDVPADVILLDPCADHTHTNLRNTGRLIEALGGRAAFVVTDDFLQSGYLEEWTFFDLMGGSIDQRALRDWHHLIGSWRRASDGINAGFWFTPYRFWADERWGHLRCGP